jgi:hypothetical protein
MNPPATDSEQRELPWVEEIHAILDALKTVKKLLIAGQEDAVIRTIDRLRSFEGESNAKVDNIILEAIMLGAWLQKVAADNGPSAILARKVIEAARLGGLTRAQRRHTENDERDADMAGEFRRRSQHSHQSKTRLMVEIGKKNGLKRSASVEAINRGLKKLSG